MLILLAMLSSFSVWAEIPDVYSHPELGTIHRSTGAFLDRRSGDALFIGEFVSRDKKANYSWFRMNEKDRSVQRLSEVFDNQASARVGFAKKLIRFNHKRGFKAGVASDRCANERKLCADFGTPVTDSAFSEPAVWMFFPIVFPVTISLDLVYMGGEGVLTGADYLYQSRLRFGRYRVSQKAYDWYWKMEDSGGKNYFRKLAHRHFNYLVQSIKD